MPSTSSISKTSIRPVVHLNSVKPGMFSKKLIPAVEKESFWNKKIVVTKPTKPFTRPEFKVKDKKSDTKKFSINIFSTEKKTTDKKEVNKSNAILSSQFYINEDPKSQRNKVVKIFMFVFAVVVVCVALLALLLFKDISSIAKTI
ncbi:MAG: hypothetical protein WCK98_01150 [bacterium]